MADAGEGGRDSHCLANAEGIRGLNEALHPAANELEANEWRGGRDSNPRPLP